MATNEMSGYERQSGSANRKVQDSMFTDLFRKQENLFDLYRTLHPEDAVAKSGDIRNITLTNVFTAGIMNDLGMQVNDRIIILTEHQSTVNYNMPARALMYYVDELKQYIFENEERTRRLYGSSLMSLPFPEFYVVYTGDNKKFNGCELQLSDAFENKEFLEAKVKVLNRKSVDKKSILGEYMEFVYRLRKNRAVCKKPEVAIAETIRTCMKDGILSEYLEAKKGEVFDMLAEEMTVEELIGTAEQNMETGIKIGREEGIKEGMVYAYYEMNFETKEIAKKVQLTEEEVLEIIQKKE